MNFTLEMTSPVSGYIRVDNENNRSSAHLLSRNTLHIPAGHVIMISFPQFSGLSNLFGHGGLQLFTLDRNESEITIWSKQNQSFTEVYMYDVTHITLRWWKTPWKFRCLSPECFTMLFSFHPKGRQPQSLNSGRFNCSVDDYWRFRSHLDCNLKAECEDGRDEAGHCPFSSPACQGWVASGAKCYMFISHKKLQTFENDGKTFLAKAVRYCDSVNASIGQPKDERDLQVLGSAFLRIKTDRAIQILVGLFNTRLAMPNMYRFSVVAMDKTVLYHTVPIGTYLKMPQAEHVCVEYHLPSFLMAVSCSSLEKRKVCTVCEVSTEDIGENHKRSEGIVLSSVSSALRGRKQTLTTCPDGQVTHSFLSLDPHFVCEGGAMPPCSFSNCAVVTSNSPDGGGEQMISSAVFSCEDDVTRLSYTLVCDFRHDCHDVSDESFCQHPPCDAFACSSGQCASYAKRCDLVSDCMDHSDEMACVGYRQMLNTIRSYPSPVLITFNEKYYFTVKHMNATQPCPETHYRCPGEYNDCLPVYTRCNGWFDCMDHEDENDCEVMACPGFYRCFNSAVCVHADHLCDGWFQCPQRDDEWLCDMTCPAQCLCQGHTFLCSQPFSARLFPQLRCLDARGSGMTPSDLKNNLYIVRLSFHRCALATLPSMALNNLRFLDLSDNNIQVVNMSVFSRCTNLRTLILAGNPMGRLHSEPSTSLQQRALRTLDLSRTNLTEFDSRPLSTFMFLHTLNMSSSPVHTVHATGFRYTPRLANLYMDGTPVQRFPPDVFKPLSQLRTVTANTYKLCCQEILPGQYEVISCVAPRNEISSCEDLLQSGLYRVFLWLISFLSLLGNMFCLVVRVCVYRSVSTGGFHVFVTNLSMADLLMGVYIAFIGGADAIYRGKYLHFDEIWMHSVACKVAGFLSLLSSEVSVLIIWLITLDRFIVLHFPFSTMRFQRISAAVACSVTWLVGWILAITPLLPMTSHWEFFSQTGICIPLPVTRQDFKGKAYSFSVFIVFNFILFLFISNGQAFIYWSVWKNAYKTDTTKVSRDLTIARRLISVAVTDFLCWFPIGLCGLLAMADTPISSEVNVGLAIFALPLNSALNPFMYTFNMVMEKRRQSREAVLFKWLESHPDLLDK